MSRPRNKAVLPAPTGPVLQIGDRVSFVRRQGHPGPVRTGYICQQGHARAVFVPRVGRQWRDTMLHLGNLRVLQAWRTENGAERLVASVQGVPGGA